MASITKRGNGYRITVSNGRDRMGKQILETATFIPDPDKTERQNQKALERFAVEFESRVKDGKYLSGEKITFEDFTKTWLLEYATQHLEVTTVDIYKRHLEQHILPAIGHLKLSRIQPVHLNRLYNTMLQERKDGKFGGYSATTIKKIHALISSIMSTAVKWNVILENPCERVSPPKQSKNIDDIAFFTLEQSAIFLDAIDHDLNTGKIHLQHKIFLYLSLFCGLRRGETVALEWSDFDFNQHTVNISKSTGMTQNGIITKSPKNKTSIRKITVPQNVIMLLRQYQKEQYKLKLSLGDYWNGQNYVFIQDDGRQMHPSTPYKVFKGIIHRYNERVSDNALKLPDIPLHGLRHTSATLLISQNIDIRTVSNRLGHAQTSTTMNIYAHQLKKMDEKAADTIENLLFLKKC